MPHRRGSLVVAKNISARRLARAVAEELSPRGRGPAPTLDEFVPTFMEKYAVANRHKPRGIEAKESIFRMHLSPRFGSKRLDAFTDSDIQALKADLSEKKPKTVNNILTTLNKLLKTAVRWRVLGSMPVSVEFLKTELDEVGFYDFPQYTRLVREASKIDIRVHAAVLLGGDAGLRRNEMIALSPLDVSISRKTLSVRFQDWKGTLISTKGGRGRVVPMTRALTRVMAELLDNKGARVLMNDDDEPITVQTIRTWVAWAQKAAGLPHLGALHILRHTFCSHLAMRGAPVLAIKELAGHRSLRTTMRYMHLSPSERTRAIALLDKGRSDMRG